MANIKRYINSCCDDYLERVDGNVVMYEDHERTLSEWKTITEKAVKEAFQNGKKAGYGDGMYIKGK